MFNRTGITKITGAAPVQILFDVEHQMSVPVMVDKTTASYVTENGRKIVKAGTPLTGDLMNRASAFSLGITAGTKGVFTLQITTAFANDESITIAGTTYTKKAAESVADKQFSGTTAAEQVTSLLKMVTTTNYAVAAVSGATDKLGFTQKTPNASDTSGPTVSKTSSTGAIGSVTKVTDPVNDSCNAVGVLLHDVDITEDHANGTLLIWGFVNVDRLHDTPKALISAAVASALAGKVYFLKDN